MVKFNNDSIYISPSNDKIRKPLLLRNNPPPPPPSAVDPDNPLDPLADEVPLWIGGGGMAWGLIRPFENLSWTLEMPSTAEDDDDDESDSDDIAISWRDAMRPVLKRPVLKRCQAIGAHATILSRL